MLADDTPRHEPRKPEDHSVRWIRATFASLFILWQDRWAVNGERRPAGQIFPTYVLVLMMETKGLQTTGFGS